MSELINTTANSKNLRWHLLMTASAIAILSVSHNAANAADDDKDRPIVWVELGGNLQRVDTHEDAFVPPFILATPRPGPETVSPLSVDHLPRYSVAGEGKITFEPNGSDWTFSAAIAYGRSKNRPGLSQQSFPTQPLFVPISSQAQSFFLRAGQFSDVEAQHRESHTVVDFQVGRDIGIGLLGSGSSSTFNFGVRFAQFESKSSITFASNPDGHGKFKYNSSHVPIVFLGSGYHFNSAKEVSMRNFHGIGPALSWNNSTPVLGKPGEGQITMDWGLDAAVLFGRQRAKVGHQATAQYGSIGAGGPSPGGLRYDIYQHSTDVAPRSRSVVIPNVGGFVGFSARYSNAKLSFGYKADFFFGAMDGGVDTRKSENVGFFGPFATISIGLGG